jgi:hypothetical protein
VRTIEQHARSQRRSLAGNTVLSVFTKSRILVTFDDCRIDLLRIVAFVIVAEYDFQSEFVGSRIDDYLYWCIVVCRRTKKKIVYSAISNSGLVPIMTDCRSEGRMPSFLLEF